METLEVEEGTTRLYTATLKDEADMGIPVSSIVTITLKQWEPVTEAIVNGRDVQNVKNANNVTIGDTGPTAGLLTWTMQPADTAIVQAPPPPVEFHRALFEFTYNTDRKGKHEVRFRIPNRRMVL
jgi:hypothetical protein